MEVAVSDRDVIAEPVLRLRAERDTLKKDLDAAKADVKAATSQIAKDAASALVDGLEKKLAGVGAALSKAQKNAAKEAKAIQAALDTLNATKATASMGLLEKAVEKAGGVAKLSGDQVGILVKQVNALAAAGAKIPKSLVLPKAPSGGLGAGLEAGLKSAASSFSPGGALGAGIGAIGPGAVAALGAVGALTAGLVAAGSAIKSLAAQAEHFGNVASSTGLGVVQVQQLSALLEDAGFQAEDLEKIMKGLAKAIEGDGDELAKFGIDVRELRGLAPEEQLRALAKAVTSIIDPTVRAAAEMAAFGKSGAKTDAALRAMADGSFKSLGGLTEVQIKQLQELDNELDKAGRSWTNFKNDVLSGAVTVGKALKDYLTGRAWSVGDINNPAAPNAGQSAGPDAGVAGMEQELERKRKAAALEQRKKDEEEAKRRAAAEPQAFQSALASAGEALDQVKAKIAATFDPGDLSSKLDAIDEETSAAINKVRDEIAKVNLSKDLFPADKAKIVAVYDAEIAKLKELGATRKQVALDDATHKQLEQDRKDELTMLEAAKLATKGVEDLMNAAQVSSGVNPVKDLTDAIHDLGPGADTADVEMQQLLKDVAVLGGVSNLSAGQLAELQAKIEGLQSRGAKLPATFKGVVDHTREWISSLNTAAQLLDSIGAKGIGGLVGGLSQALQISEEIKKTIEAAGGKTGKGFNFGTLSTAGKVGVGLQAAQGAIGIGVDAYNNAGTNTVGAVAKGALSGAGRGAAIGAIAGPAGAVIGAVAGGIIGGVSGYFGSKAAQKKLWNGLTQSLIDQFGSLDKAKEAAAKYGIALDKALDSKNAKKLSAAIKEIQAAQNKAQQDSQNQQILAQGVGVAQQGAQDLLAIMDELSPKAKAAGQALIAAVGDAMVANGLGFLPTGALADQSTEAGKKFGAVQQGVAAAGQITQGLRQAGGIDTNFLANGGAFADALKEQAVAAALEAGKSQEEANKIGLAAVAPLLKDQLNASLESGQKLSAQTQQLIDEAKANGIDIVADPLIASLDVQNKMLAELRKANGTPDSNQTPSTSTTGGPVGPAGGRTDGGGRTFHAAGGMSYLTGDHSPRLNLQLHPNELLTVTPNATAALRGGSSSSTNAGSPTPVVSMPVYFTISGNKSPKETADQIVTILRGRAHEINSVLDRRYRA
jgi:hypothetical protein